MSKPKKWGATARNERSDEISQAKGVLFCIDDVVFWWCRGFCQVLGCADA
jgi:hypothetical protein